MECFPTVFNITVIYKITSTVSVGFQFSFTKKEIFGGEVKRSDPPPNPVYATNIYIHVWKGQRVPPRKKSLCALLPTKSRSRSRGPYRVNALMTDLYLNFRGNVPRPLAPKSPSDHEHIEILFIHYVNEKLKTYKIILPE